MALMACDDEIIPLQERIETVAGVYDIERHLLYVACTRARDHLLVMTSASCCSSTASPSANGTGAGRRRSSSHGEPLPTGPCVL